METWPLIQTPLEKETSSPGCSTTLLLTSLVLSAGEQDTHFSLKAVTWIWISFPGHLKHTVLGQCNYCSYGMIQIRKLSQVKTSHCACTGTRRQQHTTGPGVGCRAGIYLGSVPQLNSSCCESSSPGNPQTSCPKTSSAGSTVGIGQIIRRKAERRRKWGKILWKRKPCDKLSLVLPTSV